MAIPVGLANPAFVPTPFAEPDAKPVAPPPAIVLTVRFEKTARILWFALSATYATPSLMATPDGLRNLAFVPTPSFAPDRDPAIVTTLCGTAELFTQKSAPLAGVYVPAGQGVQKADEFAPTTDENVPAAHAVHIR